MPNVTLCDWVSSDNCGNTIVDRDYLGSPINTHLGYSNIFGTPLFPLQPQREQKGNGDKSTGTAAASDTRETESCSRDAIDNIPSEVKVEDGKYSKQENEDEIDDPDWEDGSIPASHSTENNQEELINGMTVEFDVSPGSAKQKAVRRATAEEKVNEDYG